MSDEKGPYDHKPETLSAPGDWHEITFRISVDTPADWSNIDLSVWAASVCRYTALKMVASALTPDEIRAIEAPVESVLLGIQVKRLEFVTDDLLHELIDEEEGKDE